MDCSELDPELHAVLKLCSENFRPKTLVVRGTAETIAERGNFASRAQVRELLRDLETSHWLVYEDCGRIKLLEPCSCQPSLGDALACPADRPRTDPGERSRRGGQREGRDGGSNEVALKNAHDRARGLRRPVRREKPLHRLTAADLADRLGEKLREANMGRGDERGHWVAVGAVNHKALAKNISRWMREDGVSPEVIATMIDIFVRDPRNYTGDGVPAAWRCFLAMRQDLLNRASRRAASEAGWSPEEVQRVAEKDAADTSAGTFAEARERLLQGESLDGVE